MDARTNLLILGSGIREQALVWKFLQSKLAGEIYVIPGNEAIASICPCIDIPFNDYPSIIKLCKTHKISTVFAGAYALFGSELLEFLRAENIRVFAPPKKASDISVSRVAFREMMHGFAIPLANGHVFESMDAALSFSNRSQFPLVVKTDKIEKAKTALCRNREDFRNYLNIALKEDSGEEHERIVVENFVEGQGIVIPAVVAGKNILTFPYFSLLKNDYYTVGICSPALGLNEKTQKNIERVILVPWIHALNQSFTNYKGLISLELVLTNKGPYVVDFKSQWDPLLAATLLHNSQTDFLELLLGVLDGKLEQIPVQVSPTMMGILVPSPATVKADANMLSSAEATNQAPVLIFQEKWRDGLYYLNPDKSFGSLQAISVHGKHGEEMRSKVKECWHKQHFLPSSDLDACLQKLP